MMVFFFNSVSSASNFPLVNFRVLSVVDALRALVKYKVSPTFLFISARFLVIQEQWLLITKIPISHWNFTSLSCLYVVVKALPAKWDITTTPLLHHYYNQFYYAKLFTNPVYVTYRHYKRQHTSRNSFMKNNVKPVDQ